MWTAQRLAVGSSDWLGVAVVPLGEFEKRVCRVNNSVVENLMDGRGGEEYCCNAEVWILFLKDAQVIDELGAKERKLAKHGLQITVLYPSNNRVPSGDLVEMLDCRIATVLAKCLDDGVENLRNVVDDFGFRHGISRNGGILAHAPDPLVGHRIFV